MATDKQPNQPANRRTKKITEKSRPPGRPKSADLDGSIKETILKTASRLFMDYGYEPISLNQIAGECSVTKAMVYYYFQNKAALFTESVVFTLNSVTRITRMLLQREGTLKERLSIVAAAYMQHTYVDFESMMREAKRFLTAEQIEEIRAAERGIHRELTAAFTEAMDRGVIRREDPLFLSHAFSAIMMLGNREGYSERLSSAEGAAYKVVELFWGGVAAKTGSS